MDERLEKALEFSNFLETQNNQKRIFLKQYKNNLIYYANGNKISVTMELISFCKSIIYEYNSKAFLTIFNRMHRK